MKVDEAWELLTPHLP